MAKRTRPLCGVIIGEVDIWPATYGRTNSGGGPRQTVKRQKLNGGTAVLAVTGPGDEMLAILEAFTTPRVGTGSAQDAL